MQKTNAVSRLFAKRHCGSSHRRPVTLKYENLEGRLILAGLTASAGALTMMDFAPEKSVVDSSPAVIAEDVNTDDDVCCSANNESPAVKGLAAGITTVTLQQEIDGVMVSRSFIIHAPDNVGAGKSYPVVFAFHGNGGIADGWTTTFGDMVNDEEFIGIYPQGYLNSWNLGSERSTADDVEFVDSIVENISQYQQMDLGNMFAMGGSNGAGMCQSLAAETDHFQAIGSIATQMIVGNEPTEDMPAISVIQIAGDQDPIISYEGGESQTGHVFYSAEESAALWASHNGIASSPTITTTTDGNVRFEWTGGEDGTSVVHYKMVGHGHGGFNDDEGGIHELVWEFFESQLDEPAPTDPEDFIRPPNRHPKGPGGENSPPCKGIGYLEAENKGTHRSHGPPHWGSPGSPFGPHPSWQTQHRPNNRAADEVGVLPEQIREKQSTTGRREYFQQPGNTRSQEGFGRDVHRSRHHDRAFAEMFGVEDVRIHGTGRADSFTKDR